MAGYKPVDPNQPLPAVEEQVLRRWRERDIFSQSTRRRQNSPRFVFYEGPPTANGRPGSHHVLSRVFKDVFPRYKTMRGYLVDRKAGWDCHGLPVELEIEQKLGLSSKEEIEDYGIAQFNQRCRESVFAYIDEWNKLTERIGFWIDTDSAYITASNEYIESVWWSLKQAWERGLLYEGHKVVPYCPRCGTALSSHEVAQGYSEVVDPSVFVRFPLAHEPGVSLLGWTTTPWTLLSNAALAVHPDVIYARVQVGSEILILAEDLVEPVLGEAAEVVERMPGSKLSGTSYQPPFDYITDYGERAHTVLEADFVTTTEGTGVVHTAVAFGEDDFRLGEQYGLKVQKPVLDNGRFDDRMGEFSGRFVKDADPEIVSALEAKGRLFRSEPYTHSYPHCWRCGTPLLYYAKASWYVRTTAFKQQMLSENEKITWYPPHIKHGRFGDWLENNVDWALSRERYWGTPLPVWRCEQGHELCIGSVAELEKRSGLIAPDDLHKPYIDDVSFACDTCGRVMYRVSEVIDAWWDSGSMPFAQWHAPFENESSFAEHFPANYICEALDQTRGWFYSLLAVSTMLYDKTPYLTVLCLGLILDPDGYKMSKSRGNVVEPWDVIERHGADAFRWYYFTSKQPWDGYRFSLDTVGESVRQFLLTLWNTYGFFVLYANVNSQNGEPVASSELGELDLWVRSRLQTTVAVATERLEDFDTTGAGRAIAAFVEDLSNWYVRRSRRRFWDGDAAAFATLKQSLVTVAKLAAPLVPFICDEIYDNLVADEPSVHLCEYPEPDQTQRDPQLEQAMQITREIVELGRGARAQAQVKVRQPLSEALVVASDRERSSIERLEWLVCDELNVKRVRYVTEADQLGRWELKPNYRTLGPRFGPLMPQVQTAISDLDPQSAASTLNAGESITITIDGDQHTLSFDDIELALRPLEGYRLERAGRRAVALSLGLDDHLRREGLAREVVHAVQAARKSAGLEVSDRIVLTLDGDDELMAATRQHESYVGEETLAVSVQYDGQLDSAAHRARIEGRDLVISLERI
jgi:isoleucyl-tRNA synthetase